MTKTLEYEKSNGLLWGEVYKIMSQPTGDILSYITANTKDWGSKSALAKSQDMQDLQFTIEKYVA